MEDGFRRNRFFGLSLLLLGFILLNGQFAFSSGEEEPTKENQARRLAHAIAQEKVPVQEGLPKGDWSSLEACSHDRGKIDVAIGIRSLNESGIPAGKYGIIEFNCNGGRPDGRSPYYLGFGDFFLQGEGIPVLIDQELLYSRSNLGVGNFREIVDRIGNMNVPLVLGYEDAQLFGKRLDEAIVPLDVIKQAVRIHLDKQRSLRQGN
ncbi:MAG: hypothetical protein AAB036_12220 [Elusimicrobiota bacterium]